MGRSPGTRSRGSGGTGAADRPRGPQPVTGLHTISGNNVGGLRDRHLWRAGRLVACGGLEPVAVAGGPQHGGVVDDPVDDRGGGRGIEEHLGPAS